MLKRTLLTAAIFFLTAPAFARPPAFSGLSYDDAIAQSTEAGTVLVVKFTADWCGPCKKMDKTTWSDQTVVAWLAEHNIKAISIDTDEHPKLARQHRANAIPLMVAFKSGIELDRSTGYMGPDDLIGWLEDVQGGTTKLDKIRAAAGDRAGPDGKVDIRARMELAAELFRGNKFDEAADEFIWLWANMLDHDESMTGVRVSFMASNMQSLATEHPPAMAQFARLRDEAEAKLREGKRSRENLHDWLVLNIRVLDDEQPVLDWIERIEHRPTAARTMRRVSDVLDGFLINHDRWALLGQIADPASRTLAFDRQIRNMNLQLQREHQDEGQGAWADEYFANGLSQAHAALLAAGRYEEAWQLAEGLLQTVNTPASQTALLKAALRARQVQSRHLELCPAADQRTIKRCQTALDARDAGG